MPEENICGVRVSRILRFPATPGFGRWKKYFPDEASTHPAKMNLFLLEYLIKTYTKEGDLICDVMAGTCSTGVLAALHNRYAICVELEEKFCAWGEEARKRVKSYQTLAPKGDFVVLCHDARTISKYLKLLVNVAGGKEIEWCKCKSDRNKNEEKKETSENLLLFRVKICEQCGKPVLNSRKDEEQIRRDAAKLSELKNKVSAVIFSPPYSGSVTGKNDPKRRRERLLEQGYNPDDFLGGRARCPAMEWRYSHSKENIGNLQHGDMDAVIFSPPYAGTSGGKKEKSTEPINRRYPGLCERCSGGKKGALSDNPDNIDNITFLHFDGIDAIITSPPYSLGHDSGDNASEEYRWRLIEQRRHTRAYGQENIAKLGFGKIGIGTVIASPPYEESLGKKHRSPRADRLAEEKKNPSVYSDNDSNISNLRNHSEDYELLSCISPEQEKTIYEKLKTKKGKPTYLSEMFRIYREVYRLVKPGGKLIVVVKCFIRNYRVIRLDEHTKKLCELAGFKHAETLAFKLPTKSFWRINYEKKYGDRVKNLKLLEYEWVLVFRK